MSTYARTDSERLALKASAVARPPRRKARTSVVRFQPDLAAQVDFINGTPVDAVPAGHIAHRVKEAVESYDFKELNKLGSPLGRTGYNPRHLLGAYMLASLQGVKSAAEIERRLRTDAAYRLVAGAQEISSETLCTFRRKNLLLFCRLDDDLLRGQIARGAVEFECTAVDSVRLEADVASSAIRTLERSEAMVKQLAAKGTTALSEEQVAKHQARLVKHQSAVEHCKSLGVTNYARTDPQAALMKFPHGGSKAGHRLTTVVAGTAFRFCLAFYLSGKPTDHGVLPPMLEALRARLRRLGVSDDVLVKTAADAGFCNEADLGIAHSNTLNIDVTLAQQTFAGTGTKGANGLFGKEAFKIDGDTATCPAGKAMAGPYKEEGSVIKWFGIGCAECPLQAQCTTAKTRKLRHNPATAGMREELAKRMAEPAHTEFFSKRGAIVESMYSVLEDAMQFRRVSSRRAATVQAEVVLKVLVYNQSRIWAMQTKNASRPSPTRETTGADPDSKASGDAGDGAGSQHKTSFFCSILDASAWPPELVDVVVDFVLDLQATNWGYGPSGETSAARASEAVLGALGAGVATGRKQTYFG